MSLTKKHSHQRT